jgi:hypothetical protein
MGKGINKLRYAYYCSFDFYYFIAALVGAAVAILFVALQLRYAAWPIPVILAVAVPCGISLALFVLKLLFSMDRGALRRAGVFGGLHAALCAGGFGLLWDPAAATFAMVGAILAGVGVGGVVWHIVRAKRIKIYPNRLCIGRLVCFFPDMLEVKWGVGSLEQARQELTEVQRAKPFCVLTPLLFESTWTNFSLSHYYIVIEMPDAIYIAQPVFWRNSFAQNARNGWLETWRWDGSTQPPAEQAKSTE